MKHKVIIKKPNETAKVQYIESSLEELQNIVDGYIEYPYLEKFYEKGISIIVNEEGKLMDLEPSIALNHKGQMIDYYCGNVIFVGTKETEDGNENDSLTDEQIDFIKKYVFNGLKCITTKGNVLDVISL
jgi:Domain of unknown function (DUF3846)